jgi:hypothetical protein
VVPVKHKTKGIVVPETLEVVCDGVVFATLINESVPAAHTGRPKTEGAEVLVDADFPSIPTVSKKRRSRKKDAELIEE